MTGITTNPNLLALIAILGNVLFFIVLIIWIIISRRKINKTHEILRELFAGKKHPNLEELLLSHGENIKILDRDIQELYNISNQIHSLAFSGLHKFASLRFNPFKDVGGDQSFAIAMLDGKNNGVVITSLYTREGTRVYSKSISDGKSEKYPLTEEEKQVIKLAIKQGNKIVQ